MTRTPFTAPTDVGDLGGYVTGSGPRVLVLHGGPGLDMASVDPAVDELAQRYEVACFQQRGLTPSTSEGEYSISEAVQDVGSVLDALGWDRAYLLGHSWGGHLAAHCAVGLADRLDGVVLSDPLGAVGDGGMEAFGAEMVARVPEEHRARVAELEEKDEAGTSTDEENLESLSLYWASYFADPSTAPPMPTGLRVSTRASHGLWPDILDRLPELEAALPSIRVPVGVLVGERSPMPTTAGSDTADRIPGAWTMVVPGAGHLPWYEAPGCMLAVMDRLVAGRG
ncbi:alpha/beta fold hydrolase [Lapillicoccus jejuensis]|uniref:Pimeloyl-ACP methyl ester carboxylesterase n=1 Tax=Lapillicoccus jejuensis TaxID=402171 RepID=A0A542E0S2_9MICO|nr:alpha/beta hydrolase [Lapillicoccus jejuensis]TQJ08948.1 pimeloyl-ACP methyl ester carboxylesterase [Lapillicoccus jejuensis]